MKASLHNFGDHANLGAPERREEKRRSSRYASLLYFVLAVNPTRRTGVPRTVALAIAQSMLGKHAAALATIDEARTKTPESRDTVNGPELSFVRSVILLRAGRREEGYAEAARLLHVPFGEPLWKFGSMNCVALLVKDDPHYEELLFRPPRL